MEENKATKTKQSARASEASESGSTKSKDDTKRKARSRKVKDSNENESGSQRKHDDDFDDAASSKSSISATSSNSENMMPSCKVILRREKFDEADTPDHRAIAHSTRARQSSKLTEENLAALAESPRKRSLRSGSVMSDKTETSARARSGRVAASQEVPAPKTPSRRSSRLLSENEKTADSPARRNLRSNSTYSEDISPPLSRTRSSISQAGTPSKSLKTKVSQIKAEPKTPSRRASSRVNKSVVMPDVIDEEPLENDVEPEKTGKSKKRANRAQLIINIDDSEDEQERQASEVDEAKENKHEKENENIENEPPKKVNKKKESSKKGKSKSMENEENDEQSGNVVDNELIDVKPVINADGLVVDNTMSPNRMKSPRVEKRNSIVLVETNTEPLTETVDETLHETSAQLQTDKPTMDVTVEPMDISICDEPQQIVTPQRNASTTAEVSKTPRTISPRAKVAAPSDLDATNADAMVDQSHESPSQNKSKADDQTSVEVVSEVTCTEKEVAAEAEKVKVPESDEQSKDGAEPDKDLFEQKTSKISTDFESLEQSDDDDYSTPAELKMSLEELLESYKPKAKSPTSTSDMSTPKPNPKPSQSRHSFSAFKEMNVSVLIDNSESASTSSPRRQSMKSKIQLAGQLEEINEIIEKSQHIAETPERMDESDVPVESSVANDAIESAKSVTPKTARMEKAKTPRSATPKQKSTENVEILSTTQANDDTNVTPKRNSSLSEKSMILKDKINDIIVGLETPVANEELERRFNKIYTEMTPVSSKEIDRNISVIVAETSQVNESVEHANDSVQATTETQQSAVPVEKPAAQEVADVSFEEVDMSIQEVNMSVPMGEVSMIESSQADLDESKPSGTDTPRDAVSKLMKTDRKSVKIVTPKVDKNLSLQKRIDTPYPDDKSILEASIKHSKTDEIKKRNEEIRANARKELKKLQESWTKTSKNLSSDSLDPIDKSGVVNKRDSLITDETKKENEETPISAREQFQKIRESWAKTSRNQASGSQEPIDKLGVADVSKSTETDVPAKKSVPARNNWATNGLIDSESEEDEHEVIAESEEDSENENEDEYEVKLSELFEAEAEEVDDYNSGDSMDEEERQEIEDNEIEEKGEDLGSEDSDVEYEDEEESEDDGFVVDDDYEDHESLDEGEEIEQQRVPKRRPSRIIELESDSSDESGDDLISSGELRDVVSVSLLEVETSIVVGTSANLEAPEEIVEGKKFPTTYLAKENEEILEKSVDNTKTGESSDKVSVEPSAEQTVDSVINKSHHDEPIEGEAIDQTVEKESTEPTAELEATEQTEQNIEVANETMANVVQPTGIEESPALEQPEQTVQTEPTATETVEIEVENADQDQSLQLENATSVQPSDNQTKTPKNKKIIRDSHNNTLPNVKRLPKKSLNKKANRTSLGDLDPNRTDLRMSPFVLKQKKQQTDTNKSLADTVSEEEIIDVEQEVGQNDGDGSSSSPPLGTYNVSASNVSSQEENNNQKSKKGDSEVITIHHSESEAGESNTEEQAAALAPVESETGRQKNKKSKRRFEEIDTDNEQNERPRLKLLRAINTASGLFVEEPMTPEKQNKYGFRETPQTPVNPHFKVLKVIPPGHQNGRNKRKSIYLTEDEAAEYLLLPKPRWQINTQFEQEQPRKRARKLDMGSTEFILQPSKANKKKTIPAELREYRRNKMYRNDIPRRDARDLIREKRKR